MTIQYDLVPFSDETRDVYLSLLPEQHRDVAYGKLDWKFRGNPSGPGLIATATKDSQIIGINAFMAGEFRIDGVSHTGYQSMDTIVTEAARGQGVFGKLIQTFYDNCDGALLYGFPNLNSSPGFFGKLGWTYFGPVPMLIRPLRTGYFLKRFSRFLPDFPIPTFANVNISSEQVTRFDQNDTETWRRFSSHLSCGLERDAEYLNWRLLDHPSEQYTALRAPDGSFIATSLANKHNGRVGYVMEAIGEELTLKQLITKALKDMKTSGADVALAWCLPNSPNYHAYRRAGFFPFYNRLRPITINFGTRSLRGDAKIIEDKSSWYLSYLDSDTV
jgi:GNAT superfamily N-acetyltransferase